MIGMRISIHPTLPGQMPLQKEPEVLQRVLLLVTEVLFEQELVTDDHLVIPDLVIPDMVIPEMVIPDQPVVTLEEEPFETVDPPRHLHRLLVTTIQEILLIIHKSMKLLFINSLRIV